MVDKWLDDHLPSTGYVGLKWLERRAHSWGIEWPKLREGLRRAGVHVWDGDGHHLTVVARLSSWDIRYPERDNKRQLWKCSMNSTIES